MLNRRPFLNFLGASSLALVVKQFSLGALRTDHVRMALLSDTHVHSDPLHDYRGYKPSENLQKAVEQILSIDASAALICGDVARANGQRGDYVQIKRLLEPLSAKMQVEVALGNHDDRDNFWTVFGGQPQSSPVPGKKHITILDMGPQRWIVLDTLMFVDKVPGFLGQDQRKWLDGYLKEHNDNPVVLMVHHTLGDTDGDLLDTDKFLEIAKSHRQVKAIFYGHSHQWSVQQKEGLWMVNLPAIGYVFEETQPVGWVHADLTPDAVTLVMHANAANRTEDQKQFVLSWKS